MHESIGRTVADLRASISLDVLTAANPAVKLLFRLRWWLGQAFGWDRAPPGTSKASFLHRLSEADREASLVPPGTPEGPFRVLYVFPREAVSEIQNATAHAFSVFALIEQLRGYRLYWAIYVHPVGRVTRWYMDLIDPFRRRIIYPSVLRRIRAAWGTSGTAA